MNSISEHLEEVKSPIVMKVEAPPDENSANSATGNI